MDDLSFGLCLERIENAFDDDRREQTDDHFVI